MQKIAMQLNGHPLEAQVEPHWTLLEFLRDHLELTGTKEGCGGGECGACTVLVDKKAVNSCLFPVLEAQGCEIITIEGLMSPEGGLHPLQQAFINHGAVQCGFCSPGMLLSAKALLDENPHPTEEEIRLALAGNFCRCTGYTQIIEAVQSVGAYEAKEVSVMPRGED
ncbi:MAG: (2Fe-2S)-binding protein [Desulfobacca sp.]|nr:(2Fe-2S)-binding protein [Desulfobacca sp.]